MAGNVSLNQELNSFSAIHGCFFVMAVLSHGFVPELLPVLSHGLLLEVPADLSQGLVLEYLELLSHGLEPEELEVLSQGRDILLLLRCPLLSGQVDKEEFNHQLITQFFSANRRVEIGTKF